jgi:predicted transcriptional regulator
MSKQNDITWLANYYFRSKAIATKKLKELSTMGVQPKHKERKGRPIHTIWLYKVFRS